MLVSVFLPGCSYATTGTATITSPTYIIPVSAINTVLGSSPIGTGDAAERLIYGLCQALFLLNKAGTLTQTNLGCECANKSLTSGIYENTSNNFTNVTLANFLISSNVGTTTVVENPTNLQVQ